MSIRYFIDRTRVAIWAWRKAEAIEAALADLRALTEAPHGLADYELADMPTVRDECQRCDGTRGVRGNENIVDGKITCDYCHAEMMP